VTTLYGDFETFSETNIKTVGAQYYARHSSTEALMFGWAIDDEPVQVWDIINQDQVHPQLREALLDPEVLISAFNAQFERLILEFCLMMKIPYERFRCSQVRAFGLAFAGSLENIADHFDVGINKDPRGKYLINRFSKLQPKSHKVNRWTRQNDPQGWAEFMEYCRQDVETERALVKKCTPYHFPDIEWSRYFLDQKINDRGVPVDQPLVECAITIVAAEKDFLKAQMREVATPYELSNPNSGSQLTEWLLRQGTYTSDLTKDTVIRILEDDRLKPRVKDMLKLKQQLAKTSVSKYTAFRKVLSPEGVVRGMFQFGGASRTLRAAGRIVQLQNLTRGGTVTYDPDTAIELMINGGRDLINLFYGNTMGLLSDCIRAVIKAPDGLVLNVSDLHSIESVVLGWMTDCKMINDCFASGRDTYRTLAMTMFNVPYDQVTKEMRTFCKPPVLGGGYMLGWKGLISYAAGMGVTMTPKEAKLAINTLRANWPEVVEFWSWCKRAVFFTTQTGKPYPGPHGLSTFAYGEFLCIRLPSGRNLYYHKPEINKIPAPWDPSQMIDAFTYMGSNRHKNGIWDRISAHAGGITENIDQAISRDVLYTWMDRADKAGFDLFLHVHDEIGSIEKTDRLAEMNSLIEKPISWAPGLKLGAAGYTAVRYKKD
jgi:DNA polymerase